MPISKEEASAISEKMRSSLKLQNAIGFSDMDIEVPDIDFYNDNDQYYDPSCNTIHLGVYGIVDLFSPETEEEYGGNVNYVRGHEEQHKRSTASQPYAWGIERGSEIVIEYISSVVEKSRRRFSKASDYEYFMDSVLPKENIYVSYRMINEIIAGISNSIEDGRIERIRSNRFPGFEALRIYHRGKFWQQNNEVFKPYEEIKNNSAEKLRIVCNQILSLATCQLYEKNFVSVYAGTPIIEDVNKLMPYIAKGVMAGRCRDMAMQVVEISKILAPWIYDACKLSASDVENKKALEKLLADLIKSMVDAMPDNMGISEKNEDTDEGSIASTMPHSDLVITLPDDVYDKLVANSKNGPESKSESGLMIKREHPKQDDLESDDTKKDSDNSGSGSEPDDTKKNSDGSKSNGSGSKGSAKDSESDDTEDGSDGSGSESDDTKKNSDGSKSNGSGSKGSESDDTKKNSDGSGSDSESDSESDDAKKNSDGSGSKGSESDDTKDGSDNSESGSESDNAKKNSDGTENGSDGSESNSESKSNATNCDSSSSSESNSGSKQKKSESDNTSSNNKAAKTIKDLQRDKKEVESEIEKAMKEAAGKTNAESRKMIDTINNTNAHANMRSKHQTEVLDKSKPITQKDVSDICRAFVERKRVYKVTSPLPPVIAARGNVLHRKNENYFKSLSSPNVSFLDSGAIDPSRIYGLSFGDTQIFRKNGKDKKFDGCAYVLIDNSGSMGNDKRAEACKAGAIIEEGFRNIIPIKIVAFDENRCITHEVIKGWDESLNKNCCWNFCLHGRHGNGNEDGYDIMIATKELLARPENKKLLVILSDGAPGNCNLVRKAVESARKKGIKVCSIYFEQGRISEGSISEFRNMYQKDYICCNPNDIGTNLSKIFKTFSRS